MKIKKILIKHPKLSVAVLAVIILLSSFFIYKSVFAATRTWDGGGTDETCGGGVGDGNKWSCAANWSDNTVPVAGDTVEFNDTSDKDATIDASFQGTITILNVNSGYDGTITMARSLTTSSTITVASGTFAVSSQTLQVNSTFTVSGGTFNGNNGTVDVNGNFAISGGDFISTTGTMSITGSFTKTNSPTFNANGGTIALDGTTAANTSIDAPEFTFNLVTIDRTINITNNYTFTIASDTIIPLGDAASITLNNSNNSWAYYLTNNGTITSTNSSTLTFNVESFTNAGAFTANSITTFIMNGNFTNNGTTSMTSCTTLDFNNYGGTFGAAGSFTNNASKSLTTAANPIFNVEGSLTIDSTSTTPANITLNLDGTAWANTTVDANGYTFVTPVTIDRTINVTNSYTFTIALDTVIPLGDAASITLNNSSGSWAYHFTNNGTITSTNSSTLTFNVDGTFTNTGAFTANSITSFVMNGNLINNGTISMTSATTLDISDYGSGIGSFTNSALKSLTTAANPTFNVAGNLTIDPTSTTPANITLNLDGSANTSTTIDANGYTFAAPTTISRSVSGATAGAKTLLIATGTTIPLGSTASISLNHTYGGIAYNLTNEGTLTSTNNGTLTFNIDGTFTNTGTFTANSMTTFTMNGSFTNNGSASMTSATTLDMSDWNTGVGSFANNALKSLVTAANPTFNVAGNLTIDPTSTTPANITLNLDGTAWTSATIDANGYTFAAPTTISRSISGAYAANPIMTIALGTTLPLGSTASISLNQTYGSYTYSLTNNGTITSTNNSTLTFSVDGTFTNSGTFTANNATSFVMNGSFTNDGTASMDSATTLDINNWNNGVGNLTNNANKSLDTGVNNPSLSVIGNVSIDSTSTFPTTLSAFTLDGTSGTQTVSAANITNYGNFSKTAGSTFSPPSNMTVADFTYSGGTISNPGSAYTFSVSGNFSQSSANTLGGANLTILFNGSGTQTITHSAGTFSSIFNVNKSSGKVQLSTNFTTTTEACNIQEGTFELNGKTFTCGGVFTVESGGNLQLIGIEILAIAPTLSTGSTVTYVGDNDAEADAYSIINWTYDNLTVNFTDILDSLTASSTNTLVNNLVIYYAMEEASWTGNCSTLTVADSSGNNLAGKACPNASAPNTSATHKIGTRAGAFDGSNDYVLIDDNDLLDITSAITLSAWVYPRDTTANYDKVIAKGWSSNISPWNVYTVNRIASTQRYSICVSAADLTTACSDTISSAPLNQWTHIVGTYDGANTKIYFNGVLEDFDPYTKAIQTNTRAVTIGSNLWTSTESSNMIIDDSRIYNRALTQGEVSSLARALTDNTITSVTVNGNLTITQGILTAPATLTIGGNFTNNGTFTHNSGTVVFNGAGDSILAGSGNPAISFNNLTTTTAGKNLKFTNGETFQINGTLTTTGSDSKVNLISTTTGQQWFINHQGNTENITYTYVKDSGCNVSSNDITATSVTNQNGNNNGTCWLFSGATSVQNPRVKGDTRIKSDVRTGGI